MPIPRAAREPSGKMKDHIHSHALVDQVNKRFAHTALYCEALDGSVDFLIKMGIKPKAKLVACSRAPLKKN